MEASGPADLWSILGKFLGKHALLGEVALMFCARQLFGTCPHFNLDGMLGGLFFHAMHITLYMVPLSSRDAFSRGYYACSLLPVAYILGECPAYVLGWRLPNPSSSPRSRGLPVGIWEEISCELSELLNPSKNKEIKVFGRYWTLILAASC